MTRSWRLGDAVAGVLLVSACHVEPGLELRFLDASGASISASPASEIDRDFSRAPAPELAAWAEWSGTIWVPAEGLVGLKLIAGDDARVLLDDAPVPLLGGRIHSDRAPRIRVLARPTGLVRLLWSPVGRPFVPERIPPGAFGASDPGQRDELVPRFPAESLRALIFVFGALVLIGVAWFFCIPRGSDREALGLLALAFLPRLLGIFSAGALWDEDTYFSAGRNLVVGLMRGELFGTLWLDNPEHPPLTKLLAGSVAVFSDALPHARIPFVALSAMVAPFSFAVVRALGGSRLAGLASGVIVALSPPLVAHGRAIGHEAPTCFFFVLAMAASLREERARAAVALAGVCLGLALATRFSNVLLVAPLVMASWARGRPREALLLGLFAGVAFVLTWPALWTDPIGALSAARSRLLEMEQARLRFSGADEWYLGHRVSDPPASYLLVYVFAKTPLLVLLAAVLGLSAMRSRARALLVVSLASPFAVDAFGAMTDGVRYVLPALVVIAWCGGFGLSHILELVDRHSKKARALVLVAGALHSFGALASTWPYPLDYAGIQVGGERLAWRLRWLDFGGWGEGVGECVKWTSSHVRPGASVRIDVMPPHLGVSGLALRRIDGSAEVWVENRVDPDAVRAGYQTVHEERAGGVVLCRVLDRADASMGSR
ncbi:MAG: glycosyltransferase family 39 protein [Deltaproteobacteria bacterium]|nr:glycosyltransferase family 39 protein [Deltaproteobacteria bacterium]